MAGVEVFKKAPMRKAKSERHMAVTVAAPTTTLGSEGSMGKSNVHGPEKSSPAPRPGLKRCRSYLDLPSLVSSPQPPLRKFKEGNSWSSIGKSLVDIPSVRTRSEMEGVNKADSKTSWRRSSSCSIEGGSHPSPNMKRSTFGKLALRGKISCDISGMSPNSATTGHRTTSTRRSRPKAFFSESCHTFMPQDKKKAEGQYSKRRCSSADGIVVPPIDWSPVLDEFYGRPKASIARHLPLPSHAKPPGACVESAYRQSKDKRDAQQLQDCATGVAHESLSREFTRKIDLADRGSDIVPTTGKQRVGKSRSEFNVVPPLSSDATQVAEVQNGHTPGSDCEVRCRGALKLREPFRSNAITSKGGIYLDMLAIQLHEGKDEVPFYDYDEACFSREYAASLALSQSPPLDSPTSAWKRAPSGTISPLANPVIEEGHHQFFQQQHLQKAKLLSEKHAIATVQKYEECLYDVWSTGAALSVEGRSIKSEQSTAE